jgi:DNA-binding winged helix-turn-helix (wHTH) protein/tetratricopeptide (TPR) repeat protein
VIYMPDIYLYDFDRFRLNAKERLLLRDGKPVSLTIKAFEVLLTLVQNRGRLIEKEELIKKVWQDTAVEEGNLTVNISVLRKALGEGTDGRRYIETVPRKGYRFIAVVREISDFEAGVTLREPSHKKLVVENGKERGGSQKAIAVLPFQFLGKDKNDEYLGLGIADAIITRLSNLHQIIVRPTSAVLKYAGNHHDHLFIGRELQVEAVLEGSIQREPERVRVTTQLVRILDATVIWAEKFDETFTDIFSIEDKISEQVSQSLLLKLTGEERKLLTKHYTENTEAYRLYLKGLYYTSRATRESAQKGIGFYNQAIDLDPTYALAFAGLAEAYCWLSHTFLSPKEAMPKARLAAMKALELDGTLGEAHYALALIKMWHDWDWPAVEKAFRQAIHFSPNFASAYSHFGFYLTTRERFEEAFRQFEVAQEIDPLSPLVGTGFGWALYFARRYDEAIEQWQKTLEIAPDFLNALWGLGWCFAIKGDYEKAIAYLQKAMVQSSGGVEVIAALGYSYAKCGERKQAQKLLDELSELATKRYVSPFYLALVYAGFDEKEQTIEYLERAYQDKFEWLVQLKVDPPFYFLHTEPRFQALLRKLGHTS